MTLVKGICTSEYSIHQMHGCIQHSSGEVYFHGFYNLCQADQALLILLSRSRSLEDISTMMISCTLPVVWMASTHMGWVFVHLVVSSPLNCHAPYQMTAICSRKYGKLVLIDQGSFALLGHVAKWA